MTNAEFSVLRQAERNARAQFSIAQVTFWDTKTDAARDGMWAAYATMQAAMRACMGTTQ